MEHLRVGIIGPTNMAKVATLTGRSLSFFSRKAEAIGKTLAEIDCELWVNSDGGMISKVALAYKKYGGKQLVVLYPGKGEPWPDEHVKIHLQRAHKLSKQENWFWTNYGVVTIPDVCVCVGLSAGTLSELAYIKWNCQFRCGNLKHLVAIRELVRGRRLPLEIEVDVRRLLTYTTAEGLGAFFKKIRS